MRALMFRGPMGLAWEEVETPQLIEPRDALVRPIAVARCDLDPAIALGLYPMPAPFVMGHEMVGEVIANYTSLISTAKEVLSQWPKCQGVEKQAAQLQYCLMDLYLGIAYTFSRYSCKCDEQFAYALAVCEFLQTLPHKYVRDAYVIPISRGDKDCTLDRDAKESFAKSLLKDFLSKYMSENKNYKAHMAISTVIMSSALPSAEKCEFARHLDECLRR